jgi:hypothetical protein
MSFGLHHGFDEPVSSAGLFVLTSAVPALQIQFGVTGYAVMQPMGYFRDFLRGDKKHTGSYALVCPGVAFFVFGMFFLAFGLQETGLVERFTLPYFAVLAPLVYVQLKTVMTMLALNSRLLGMCAVGKRGGSWAPDPSFEDRLEPFHDQAVEKGEAQDPCRQEQRVAQTEVVRHEWQQRQFDGAGIEERGEQAGSHPFLTKSRQQRVPGIDRTGGDSAGNGCEEPAAQAGIAA